MALDHTPLYVFLDKDGTLVEDVPYNVDPERMALMPGAAKGLRMLAEAGAKLVVVSNQSGVARGYFKEEALAPMIEQLQVMIREQAGAELEGFYYCPHHPDGVVKEYAIDCACRKPQHGLLLQAARELKVDLFSAWMVGDILNDVEAGKRTGCRAILIDNGHETEWQPGPYRQPDFIVKDLEEAAQIILNQTERQTIERNEHEQ